MSTTAPAGGRPATLRWADGDRLDADARTRLMGPGAPFEMTTETVLGTPLEVFVRRPRTLRDLLLAGAERNGEKPYLAFPERELTFASIVPTASAIAASLAERYGIGAGDRVGIAAANVEGWATTFWAVTLLGGITVALNGWWTGPELLHGIGLTEPKVVLGDRRRLERLDGEDAGVPLVAFEDELASLESAGAGTPVPEVAMAEDDPFLIQFTSGTTGRPKGAVVSHRANIHFIFSNILGALARGALLAAGTVERPPGAGGSAPSAAAGDHQPCVISASPLFHISGCNAQLVMSTVAGTKVVYPPPGRWEERRFLELSERHRATSWSLVPTQLWRILQCPDLDRFDLSSVQSVGGGGSVWPPELLRLLEQRLPGLRPNLGVGYGMTETSGLGTNLRVPETFAHPESVGGPAPGVEVQIRDPERRPLPEGVVGEVCLRTASAFLGYWNQPDATSAALDADRWYHTGDLGRVEGGLLYLESRRSDLIIRGGENVYPIEIENRLLEHADIDEAAVVGVEHPTLGQEVKAVIVVRRGASLDDEDVRAWVAGALAAFKVPSIVERRDRLPHNAAGKVMKHLLTQLPAAGEGGAGAPRGDGGFVEDE